MLASLLVSTLLATSEIGSSDVLAPPPPPVAAPANPALEPPRRATRKRKVELHSQWVLQMGFDRGGEKLVTVTFDDGSKQSLSANQGLSFAAGAGLLRVPVGEEATMDTLVTLGVKGWNVGSKDDQINYLTFPLEVMQRLWVKQVRFGAGITHLLSPRLSGSGTFSRLGRIDLKNSTGFVLQGEWIGDRYGYAGIFLGARYVWQELEAHQGSGSVDASGFGVVLGLEL